MATGPSPFLKSKKTKKVSRYRRRRREKERKKRMKRGNLLSPKPWQERQELLWTEAPLLKTEAQLWRS